MKLAIAIIAATAAVSSAFAPSTFGVRTTTKLNLSEENMSKLVGIITEQLECDEDKVTLEASFQDDLEADSLDVVEMVMAVEEAFEIEVDDDSSGGMSTVGDVVSYLDEKM
uniref:Acyl carrier protein n=1 Tax=Grammatophora oceanica TaxID=210454 RepID=A0A7S1VJ19_9STRA|mmetsp:Transcript_46382/g.69058  ORF Transcript_46382/g.69058 Transcript_46382/m.69058 type:complete len:111 (+) Transcript_46382:109-441(+)|eukprot:CAMPEP_0194042184 /NCGR_PEP_ID=MMETSP0009_2-20130614/13979_1 /TAXON_ID=210454 /ORGANISM="Grammatophora oceanica, Strain CCMP 410" /LENGTH=110 /DNA_ID=CAMNT_0038685935 /DNA_START=109 /DNA_END=441 /DNA_ORIENTATION=-